VKAAEAKHHPEAQYEPFDQQRKLDRHREADKNIADLTQEAKGLPKGPRS
jgi:hypothetical protein